jgi:hypothetical protein
LVYSIFSVDKIEGDTLILSLGQFLSHSHIGRSTSGGAQCAMREAALLARGVSKARQF